MVADDDGRFGEVLPVGIKKFPVCWKGYENISFAELAEKPVKKVLFPFSGSREEQENQSSDDNLQDCNQDDIAPGDKGFDEDPDGNRIPAAFQPVRKEPADKQWLECIGGKHHCNDPEDGDESDGVQGRVQGEKQRTHSEQSRS
jgi:hypothetical protein